MVVNKLKSMILLVVVVVATCSWNHINMNLDSQSNHFQGSTICDDIEDGYEVPKFIKEGIPSQFLKRFSYKTSYNKETRTPNWVGWVLTSEHTDGEYARKGHSFIEDLDVPLPRAIPADIRESECGYQRGHMCPAGDNKWSYKAQKDAFLMTNICPQNGNLNQHDWKYLEEACREWAKKYGRIYIVAGPIFYSNRYKTVGERQIAVPDAFFKVVLRIGQSPEETKAIGFIYSNQMGHHNMKYYVHAVDEVERITGLDFFYQLDDEIENKIERECSLSNW